MQILRHAGFEGGLDTPGRYHIVVLRRDLKSKDVGRLIQYVSDFGSGTARLQVL